MFTWRKSALIVVFLIAVVMGGIVLRSYIRHRFQMEKVPHIEVWLNDSCMRIRGLTWPKNPSGQAETFCGIERCILTVHLPDGRQWTHPCRGAGISCYDGSAYVSWVHADYTPTADPVTFSEVVRESRDCMTQLAIPKDDPAWQRLDGWEQLLPDREPSGDTFIQIKLADNNVVEMNFENHDGLKGGTSNPKWGPGIWFEHL